MKAANLGGRWPSSIPKLEGRVRVSRDDVFD
jgi:hypothetical protein